MNEREWKHRGVTVSYRRRRYRFENAEELIQACIARVILAIFDRLMFMMVAIALYRLFTRR